MKQLKLIFSAILIALLPTIFTFAQTAGGTTHYEKGDLAFDYPASWKLTDTSIDNVQRITIASEDGAAEVGVLMALGADQCDFEAAGKRTASNWLEHIATQIRAARPIQTAPVKTQVGVAEIEGLQIRGLMKKSHVAAEVYSLRLKLHLVALAYWRAVDDAQAELAWELIRKTLAIKPPILGATATHKTDGIEANASSGSPAPIASRYLNGQAVRLVQPPYPAIAIRAHAHGTVEVQIVIDETGDVIAAQAISGHPLLQAASVNAAKVSKFSPTKFCGEPVRVAGLIQYNFVTQ